MKKILLYLLILCSISTFAQAEFPEGIQVTNAQDNTALKVNVQNATGVINWKYLADFQKEKAILSTGLLKNGLISANGDPTKFNITAGIGIISNFDDPENPTSTIVNFPAFTGITPTYLLTGTITYVAINSTPAVVMQATPFTPEQRRSLIVLGAVIHSNLTTINVLNNISAPSNADTNQLHDFIEAVGALNLTGNKYSANGANLQLNKSAGLIFKLGSNFANDWKNPHELAQTAGTSLTFRYRTQNGTEGSDRINLDPSLYDLNNVLTAVPNNKFTIQTVTMFQSGLTRIQYGQNVYDDLATAKNAVFIRNFVLEPNSKENGIIRAYIIMRNTTTSLQNVADADILEAQKFGGVASGGVALTLTNIVSALGYTPENVANKQNSLTVDGTGIKYPTIDAVNANLVNKLDTEGARLDATLTPIYAWGDSLTQANLSQVPYTTPLQNLSLFTVTNKGIGGETSTQIKDRMIADSGNYSKSVIIWAGRNNYASPSTVKADIATMIAALGHTRYLVVSVLNADTALEYKNGAAWLTITTLNADLKSLYGEKYVEAREYLVSLHNNTAQDLIDFANDIPPTSLRIDGTHLNTLGYSKIAELFNKKLGSLYNQTAYFQAKDFKYYFENNLPLHTTGNETKTGVLTLSPTVTASPSAKGVLFTPALNTTSNNNTLIGLEINPTYGIGAFTGTVLNSLRAFSGSGGFAEFRTAGGMGGVSILGAASSSNAILRLGNNWQSDGIGVERWSLRLAGLGGLNAFQIVANDATVYAQMYNTNGNLILQNGGTYTDAGYRFDVNGISRFQSTVTIGTSPTTSAGTYDFLTRNTSTGVIEKVTSASVAPTASPTLTGDPKAPTPTLGDNDTSVATTAFVTTVDSNNVKLTGNQTKTGILTFNHASGDNYISLSNSGSNPVLAPMVYQSSGAGSGLFGYITGSGSGNYVQIQNNGIGFRSDNYGSGICFIADAQPGTITDLFRFRYGGDTTSFFNYLGELTSPKITMTGTIELKAYTVATLPTGVQGATAYVTDATTPTYLGALTGGGSVKCPVFYNGTAWVSH